MIVNDNQRGMRGLEIELLLFEFKVWRAVQRLEAYMRGKR